MSQATETAAAPELKTYYGNCHCGAFKFHIKMPELTSVHECNCSICFKKGYKWIFPGAGCYFVEKGEGTLKDYEFGPCKMAHKFCATCGTGVQGLRHNTPPGMDVGINARTLRDVDIFSLTVNKYDGAALDPKYSPPKYTGPEPSAEIENAKTYYGSCHCGAATMAMKTNGPLTDGKQTILECDCSICMRDGTTLTYPPTPAFTISSSTIPSTPFSSYSYGRMFNEHKFCPVCGVSLYIHKRDNIPAAEWKKWKGDASPKEWNATVPVNLRCFEGVEWEELREKGLIKRGDWGSKAEPQYVCPE